MGPKLAFAQSTKVSWLRVVEDVGEWLAIEIRSDELLIVGGMSKRQVQPPVIDLSLLAGDFAGRCTSDARREYCSRGTHQPCSNLLVVAIPINISRLLIWTFIEHDSESSKVHEQISSIDEGFKHSTLDTTSATCRPSTIHLGVQHTDYRFTRSSSTFRVQYF